MPKKQYHSHGPQDFAEFITPEKAYEFDCSLNTPPAFSLKEYKHAAHSHQRCCVCGAPAWTGKWLCKIYVSLVLLESQTHLRIMS